MNWYYSQNGQQAGPVTDEELAPLIRGGAITPATLVWHSGLPGWQPFAEAGATLPEGLRPVPGAGGVAPGADQALCSQCGNVFPADEVVQVSGYSVCGACKPLLLQKLQQGVAHVAVYGAQTVRYAGFWIRFGAAILDGLIVLPVSLALNFLFSLSLKTTVRFDPNHPQNIGGMLTVFGVYYVVILVLYSIYNGICLSRYGGMPGMLICGLRVIRPEGRRITFMRGVGRYFANSLSAMILGLGYLFIVFDDQKRALHDYVCDTRVVYK